MHFHSSHFCNEIIHVQSKIRPSETNSNDNLSSLSPFIIRLSNKVGLIIGVICFWNCLSFGQTSNFVQFYEPGELDVERVFSTASFNYGDLALAGGEAYKKAFFRVWHADSDESIKETKVPAFFKRFFAAEESLEKSDCYAGNFNPFRTKMKQQLVENTSHRTFPNMDPIRGLITTTTNVRRLPTSEYCWQGVRDAGEGYPFDYFQQTSLWIGTPVMILHQSKDQLWYFVHTPYSNGWVKAKDVVGLSNGQSKQWEKLEFCSVVKEKGIVSSLGTHFIVRVGMVLPQKGTSVLFPIKKVNGGFRLIQIPYDRTVFQPFPLAFNPRNVTQILEGLHHSKYTWGGIDGGRDCSATIKDFLTPFGIWMPRNSSQQKDVGKVISLEGNHLEKKNKIKELGIPFLSVIYKRGHSMLYVGTDTNGTPLIFHNVWGLKPLFKDERLISLVKEREDFGLFGISQKGDKVAGRYIIGRAVITPVDPESGYNGITFDSFLDNIESIALIAEK